MAIPSATRGPHLQAEGGLDRAAIAGATLKPRRLAEGGVDVACSQARSKQVQYLNAQQAHLECEIEKEFLSPGLRFTQGLTTFTNLYGIFYTPFTPFYGFLRLFTNHFLQNNNTNQRLY